MTTGLMPYPSMKASGVPWLGDVPAHWTIKRLKSSMSNVIQQTAERQATDLYVALEHVESWTGRLRQAASDVQFDSQVKRFRSGDVLFGKLRPYLAKVTRPLSDGVCVGEFLVLRARDSNITPAYVEQLLRSKPIIEAVNSSTFGAKMPRADWQFIGGMAVTVPPLPEQAAIVRFLDHADRQIRRYVHAKQMLTTLLEEQKQAITHRAVTRGLETDVRLKDSGVDWLGEVPDHWELSRAKRLFREVDDRSATGTEVLLSLRMHRGLVPHNEVSPIPIPSQSLIGFKRVEPGQIVMNRMRAAIGLFGLAHQPGIVSPDYAVLEPIARIDPMYFLLLFKTPAAGFAFRAESKGLGNGSSGFMRLYTDRFGVIKLPVPPEDEQRRIVQGIATSTEKIGRAQAKVSSELALLDQYRSRLIADVVTGKVDIRKAAALLADEPEDGWGSLDEAGPEESAAAVDEEDTEAELEDVET